MELENKVALVTDTGGKGGIHVKKRGQIFVIDNSGAICLLILGADH